MSDFEKEYKQSTDNIIDEIKATLLSIKADEAKCLVDEILSAKKARKAADCKIVHIGSNPNSPMKDIADFMVRIPVRTKEYLDDELDSCQPMTSLFEQSLLLFGDILAKMIIDDKHLDMKALWKYHANLE